MQYRDVYNILPGSYLWRTPSPGSNKSDPVMDGEYFKWDYKTPYRDSHYYARRMFQNEPDLLKVHTNYKYKMEDFDKINNIHPGYKEKAYGKGIEYLNFNEKSVEESKEFAADFIKTFFEKDHLLDNCK
jgi:hypothetical protein